MSDKIRGVRLDKETWELVQEAAKTRRKGSASAYIRDLLYEDLMALGLMERPGSAATPDDAKKNHSPKRNTRNDVATANSLPAAK